MIEKHLEIFIVTYNRSKYLKRTLEQLLDSPFAGCKITILNNCSTDKTLKICQEFEPLFEQLKIISHRLNIGANPNILRAVELSSSDYTWILADDDIYDFNNCEDTIDAITENLYDIISVSWGGIDGISKKFRNNNYTCKKLVIDRFPFFIIHSFIASFIFKTERFNNYSLAKGYINVTNLYPHMPFIISAFEQNYFIYLSKNEIVIKGKENDAGWVSINSLTWIMSWVNTCSLISDKKVREKAIAEAFYNKNFFYHIVRFLLNEKAIKENGLYKINRMKKIMTILLGLNGVYLFQYCIALLFLLIPTSICEFLRKIYLFASNRDLLKEKALRELEIRY